MRYTLICNLSPSKNLASFKNVQSPQEDKGICNNAKKKGKHFRPTVEREPAEAYRLLINFVQKRPSRFCSLSPPPPQSEVVTRIDREIGLVFWPASKSLTNLGKDGFASVSEYKIFIRCSRFVDENNV